MSLPLVSIITPSLNQAKFIEQTLLSIKGQDYPNIEHLVIDGGSTDGTLCILKQYETKYNLKWLSEQDKGQSDAINKGFKSAKGNIIGWLNSDDTYMPGAITLAVAKLGNDLNSGWVYGDAYWIDEQGYVVGLWKARPYDYPLVVTRGQYMAQPTIFFRNEVLKRTGFLDPNYHYIMDTDLILRLGLISAGVYIPEVLATRRLQSNAKTVTAIHKFGLENTRCMEAFFKRKDLPMAIRKSRKESLSNAYFYSGRCHFSSGLIKQAKRNLLSSLIIDNNLIRIDTIKRIALLIQICLNLKIYIPGRMRKADKMTCNNNIRCIWKNG